VFAARRKLKRLLKQLLKNERNERRKAHESFEIRQGAGTARRVLGALPQARHLRVQDREQNMKRAVHALISRIFKPGNSTRVNERLCC